MNPHENAERLERDGDFAAALKIYRGLLTESLSGESLAGVGRCLLETSNPWGALEILRLGKQLFPDIASLYWALAQAEADTGDFIASVELFERLRLQHPESPDALLGVARGLMLSGDVDRASEMLEAALLDGVYPRSRIEPLAVAARNEVTADPAVACSSTKGSRDGALAVVSDHLFELGIQSPAPAESQSWTIKGAGWCIRAEFDVEGSEAIAAVVASHAVETVVHMSWSMRGRRDAEEDLRNRLISEADAINEDYPGL